MIERTKERAGGLPVVCQLRNVVADGFGIEADKVLLFNILHCDRPVELLRSAAAALVPGGEVVAIHWRYGDAIRAFGFIAAPPRLGAFDYREYLARKGIFSLMSYPDEVLRIGENMGSPLYAALLGARDALRRSAQQIMPAPESALLNGILIVQ